MAAPRNPAEPRLEPCTPRNPAEPRATNAQRQYRPSKTWTCAAPLAVVQSLV